MIIPTLLQAAGFRDLPGAPQLLTCRTRRTASGPVPHPHLGKRQVLGILVTLVTACAGFCSSSEGLNWHRLRQSQAEEAVISSGLSLPRCADEGGGSKERSCFRLNPEREDPQMGLWVGPRPPMGHENKEQQAGQGQLCTSLQKRDHKKPKEKAYKPAARGSRRS